MRRTPLDPEAQAAICEAYSAGAKMADIGAEHGVDRARVSRILRAHGIRSRSHSERLQGYYCLFTPEQELSIRRRYEQGEKALDMAREFGTSDTVIRRAVRRAGGSVRPAGVSHRKLSVENEKLALDLYAQGKTMDETAALLGCSRSVVFRLVARHGTSRSRRRFSDEQEQHICDLYSRGMGIQRIGRRMGCNFQLVHGVLKRHDAKMRSSRETRGDMPASKYESVTRLYDSGRSSTEVAQMLGVCDHTVRRIVRRIGGQVRPRGGGGDSVEDIIQSTGRHAGGRECEFYIYELANDAGFCKVGISFDSPRRSLDSRGEYGEQAFLEVFSSRAEARLVELAVLDFTKDSAVCPKRLLASGWPGATEVRHLPAAQLVEIASFFADAIKADGKWQFAIDHVPLTGAQKRRCRNLAKACREAWEWAA